MGTDRKGGEMKALVRNPYFFLLLAAVWLTVGNFWEWNGITLLGIVVSMFLFVAMLIKEERK
jgi:hypothetical protein